MVTKFPHDPWTSGSVWLDALEQSSTPQTTLSAYGADIEAFLSWSKAQGHASPLDANAETVASFLSAMTSDGRGRSSTRRAQSAIRSYFKYWIGTGNTHSDPSRDVPRVAVPDRPPQVLTVSQVTLLLDVAHQRAREARQGSIKAASLARAAAMLETLYSSGFGVSDICALPADLADRASGVHRLDGTGRLLIINDRSMEAIKYWRECMAVYGESSNRWLFHSVRNGDIHVSRSQMHRDCEEAAIVADLDPGFGVSPQIIRESLAVHLIERGMPIAEVAHLLGYADLKSLERLIEQAERA